MRIKLAQLKISVLKYFISYCNTIAIVVATVLLGLHSGASARADEPKWFNGSKPTSQARLAVGMLLSAASHGLEPKDYNAEALTNEIALANLATEIDPLQMTLINQRLTKAMQQYLSDLHVGRVDPRKFHHNFMGGVREPFESAQYLQNAVNNQRLIEAVKELEPRLPLYGHLREALASYRKLVDHPAWRLSLPPLTLQKTYAGLALLSQRLIALGDLSPNFGISTNDSDLIFEGALRNGVIAFQQRHGLPDKGVLGKATLAQLEIQPATRIRQLELALERLRWTPLMQAPRMVVINIPEFVLRAYEVDQNQQIKIRQTMKVIVGKARDTRTPLFDQTMRSIEFSPYWNVPYSIAKNELIPLFRRDPSYMAREGFEFINTAGQTNQQVSTANLNAVVSGSSRIRQRPGPKNALGDIKFVFPNRENIFLHHTPTTQFFDNARRDFSHGCIRVEHPIALAKFVLENSPQWSEQRIRNAMGKGVSNTLQLTEPVQVLIAYGTALVRNGKLYFFDDIYGYDRLLNQAIKARTIGSS